MSDRSFVLVVNPRAGGGRAERLLPALEQALREGQAEFETVLTRGPRDATVRVREALAAGAPGVAVIGGDGTLNEAVNGFFDESGNAIGDGRWLGSLPVGTGGDFRRTVHISKTVNAMATQMLWAKPRPIDVGWLDYHTDSGEPASRAFVNIASFGIGGLVDKHVSEGPKWITGMSAYLVGTLRAMAEYRNQRVRLMVDDHEPRETDIMNVAVANGQYFGGGMHIAPAAKIDDGLFDVVSIEDVGVVGQLALAPSLYTGTILSREGVRHERAKVVRAEPVREGDAVLLDVDGETPGRLPATFTIREGALLLRA